jgi:hypothetical protein
MIRLIKKILIWFNANYGQFNCDLLFLTKLVCQIQLDFVVSFVILKRIRINSRYFLRSLIISEEITCFSQIYSWFNILLKIASKSWDF